MAQKDAKPGSTLPEVPLPHFLFSSVRSGATEAPDDVRTREGDRAGAKRTLEPCRLLWQRRRRLARLPPGRHVGDDAGSAALRLSRTRAMDFLALFGLYALALLLLLAGLLLGRWPGPRQISYAATAPWLQRISQNAVQRFCRSRNLTFVILQLALEVAVFAEYSWEIFGACLELEFRWFYLLLPYGLLAVNTGFFFLSCITDPGTITKSNLQRCLQVYSYDEVLFQKNQLCPTCTLEKPARSKHCRVCNRCVHRFDHHCVWVNNCIGALNIRYFLPYLGTLTLMAACLALLIAAFLLQVVLLSGLMLGSYQEWATEINSIVQHLFLTFPRIVLLLGFLLLLSVLVGSYTCFMSYLLLTNQTTNEWFKRRAGCPECWLLLPHQQHSTFQNEYSKGFLGNIREVFRPNIYLKKKEM